MRSSNRCWFRTTDILLTYLALAVLFLLPEARAADFGAKTSGNWSSPGTWTLNAVPGSSDTAYIGSTLHNGAAASATVILTQNQQALEVYLGYGTGSSGTLNLGNFNLTATNLYLGFNGGTGAISRGTGSFNVRGLRLSGSSLVMNVSDRTEDLILHDGSSVTTAASANVTDGVRVWSGSTLTLGADLYSGGLWDSYNIEVSGANSTLDAQFHKISCPDLSIGWEFVNGGRVPGSHVVNFLNRGQLTVGNLFVANKDLHLTAADRVDGFILSNGSTDLGAGVGIGSLYLQDRATATTTAVGNITYHVGVESGSTLTLGANLNVGIEGGSGRYVVVSGDNSTLDAQGHAITATGLLIGWYGGTNVRLLNRGDLILNELLVANQNFNLTPADQVASFALSNGSTTFVPAETVQSLYLQDVATATTSAAGNITTRVDVTSGSTLTLSANLSVSESVAVWGDNSTLNAQGHRITADTLSVGWDGGTNVGVLNKGDLAVTHLLVANQTFNLGAADQVTDFRLINGSTNLGAAAVVQGLYLQNASAATTATGNLAGSVEVTTGSRLTLGADLSVSGSVDVLGNNSTINAQFHKITADTLSLNGPTVQLLNKGELAVTNLRLVDHNLNLSAADRVVDLDVRFGNAQLGSTSATASTANVSGSVNVSYKSTLTLGADLSVTGAVRVGLDNATINAQGHNITADTLDLGWGSGGTNVRLLNRGNLAVNNLFVAQDFNLTAADRVTNFSLIYGKTTLGAGVSIQRLAVYDEAAATTSAAGNITESVELGSVGNSSIQTKLTLGADLIVSGRLDARGNTITIDAQGLNITAGGLSFEYAPGNPGLPNIRLLNDGAITVGGPMALAGGVQVELYGGNDTAQSLWLSEDSTLRIKSAATGFTLTGTTADDLLFNGTSTLTLELDGKQPGWVLRWANPEGGNHIADLNALIAQNLIVFSATNGGGFNLVSQNGYTYIVQPVPEPGAILAIASGVGLAAAGFRRRQAVWRHLWKIGRTPLSSCRMERLTAVT